MKAVNPYGYGVPATYPRLDLVGWQQEVVDGLRVCVFCGNWVQVSHHWWLFPRRCFFADIMTPDHSTNPKNALLVDRPCFNRAVGVGILSMSPGETRMMLEARYEW